jgi:acyl carrier protein
MSEVNKIKAVIFNAVDEFNLSQDLNDRLDKSENEILFSRVGFTESGKLDSLSLVYFLVTIEEYFQKEFGSNFSLNIQELIDEKEDQLKNIGSLVHYIQKKI